MFSFPHRLPLPHPAVPLAHATHLGPQSGVHSVGQEYRGPAAAGEPAVLALLGLGLVAATMLRRRQQAAMRLERVSRRAKAQVIRSRALASVLPPIFARRAEGA